MRDDLYCAVDIGGSKILLLLIDGTGNVLFREKAATPRPEEPAAIIRTMETLLQKANSECGLEAKSKPKGIGVCIAGFLDHNKGLVYQSPNLHWSEPVPFGEMMSKAFKCPVIIENDANAAVVGEVYFGAAKGHRDVIYITISTGIGGGLFLNGRLYRGSSGFAGEIGHIKPFGKGRTCNCSGNDCLEIWTSGTGLTLSARSLWSESDHGGDKLDTRWLFEQAESGNTLAEEIISQTIKNTGRGLANLVTLFNPSCLVIGGGVAGNRSDYLAGVAEQIKKEAIKPSVEITPFEVFPAELEPEAGIWGMFALLTGRVVD